MNFLGIYREAEFSPGRHLTNDAKILRLVGQVLERDGVTVQLASLDEARGLWPKADLIFSMCQGPRATLELLEWKKKGAFILNDPQATRNTLRESLCSSAREKDLAFPHSVFIATNAHPRELDQYHDWFIGKSAWLKRADVHATVPADVIKLDRWSDLNSGLVKFKSRGLGKVVLQEHCDGDEVKFYAVEAGRLFWPHYPKDSEGYPFSERALKRLAEHAAESLGLSIYGGDAIISPEGKITLIDMNDWPSFAPCRGAAASAIGKYLKDTYRARQKNRETANI
jgi:hypothetical protein